MAKKKHTRRTFVRNATIGTLAAAALTAWLVHEQPWHVPYQRWYDKNLAGLKGQKFMHPEFHKDRTPTENDKVYFEKQFEKFHHKFEAINNVKYYEGKRFTEFPGNDSTFKEFQARARKATEQFFSYCGIKNEIPQLAFHRLTAKTPLTKEQDALHCYIVGTLDECVIARYEGILKDGREGGVEIVYGESVGGHLEIKDRMMFVGKDIGFRFEEEKVLSAFIAAARDSAISYTSVSAEALHYVVRAVRRDYNIEDLNQWWHENGKPKQVTGEQMGVFSKEWLYREEGVVHALLDDFLEKQQARERFHTKEMNDYIHTNNSPPYHYVPHIRAHLKTTTPAALLKEYRTHSRALFARLQR